MKRFCVCLGVLVAFGSSMVEANLPRARGGGVCRSRQVVVNNQAAFAAVPFAVPVAVPVAAVVQPTYLYAYAAYSAQAAPPVATPTSAATAAPSKITEADSESLDKWAVEVVTRRCVSCHSGEGANGELMIADEDGTIAAALPRHRMLRAIESGKMPPEKEGPPLEAAEIEAIRHWARLPRDLAY